MREFWIEYFAGLLSAVTFAVLTSFLGWLFIRMRKDKINKRVTDYVLKIMNNVEDRRDDAQGKDPQAK